MKPHAKMSLLAKSIIIATTSGLLAAPVMASEKPVVHTGIVDSKTLDNKTNSWSVATPNTNANLSDPNEGRNIYYSYLTPRSAKDTQTLTVNNTDLSGHYINLSSKGNAALVMHNSSTDFVESGNNGETTNTSVVLDHSILKGAQNNHDYDNKNSNKNYLAGAVIYQDKKDNGALNVTIQNGSKLSGGIESLGGGDKTLSVSGKSTVEGNILFRGAKTQLRVKDSTLSQVVLGGTKSMDVDIQRSTMKSLVGFGNHADTQVNVADGSRIQGDVNFQGINTSLHMSNSSTTGNVTLSGKQGAKIELQHADIAKNLTVSTVGDVTVNIADKSHIHGDVKLGTGGNTVRLSGKSTIEGSLDGGSDNPKNMLEMEEGSAIKGHIAHIASIKAHGNNTLSELKNQSLDINRHSHVSIDTMANATINTDTSSRLSVIKSMVGQNVLNVRTLAADVAPGSYDLVHAAGDSSQLLVQFANKRHAATARAGARNYRLALSEQATSALSTAPTSGRITVQVAVTDGGLANDVRGAIAGLEGARQSGTAVADSIASHLNTAGEVREGASIWTDYLLRNGNNTDAVDYHNRLQGNVIGMDWTRSTGENSHLTSGVALGFTQNRLSDRTGDFHDKLTGHFYSLYTGWQQAISEDCCGFFAHGNFTYGDIRYALDAQNVGSSTSGALEQLRSSSKGSTYNVEVRGGMNIRPFEYAEIQPYSVVGWSKATADGYTNNYVKVDKNSNASWYAGGGVRLIGHLAAGSVALKPWMDAAYTSEFGNESDFRVNDVRVSHGKKRQVGTVGAGMDMTISSALNVNAGVYSNTGHTRDNISVLAGIKYNF